MSRTLEMLVNPFKDLNSDSPDHIEERKEPVENEQIKKAVEKLQSIYWGYYSAPSMQDFMTRIIYDFDLPQLMPSEIDFALRQSIKQAGTFMWPSKLDWAAGLFFSKLIEDSYEVENNNFVLTTDQVPIDYLCSYIRGLKGNPLKITLNGSAGNNLAELAEYCEITVKGNVGNDCAKKAQKCSIRIEGFVPKSLGLESENSKFLVKGNVYDAGNSAKNSGFGVCGNTEICGLDAKGSTFYMEGNVGFCGVRAHDSEFHVLGNVTNGLAYEARRCRFIIHGDFDENWANPPNSPTAYIPTNPTMPIRNCGFYTRNVKTFEKLQEYAREDQGNTVMLI